MKLGTGLSRIFFLILITTCIFKNSIAKSQSQFFIEPYLQNVTQTAITIHWWTSTSTHNNNVVYGKHKWTNYKKATNSFVQEVGKFLNEVTIDKLAPETKYRYFVRSDDKFSDKYSFKTAPNPGSDFHFVLLGDGRTDNNIVIRNHRNVTKLAMKQKPDIAFHLGDMVLSGDQDQWDIFWRRIATNSDLDDPGIKFASYIPYYLVVGNHEIYSKRSAYNFGNRYTTMAIFKAYVSNPNNFSKNELWEERYYSFQYGVATFIILDTNNSSADEYDNHNFLPDGSTPDWEPNSEQYLWLVKELKKAKKNSVFTFILMHPAPYSRGPHGSPEEHQSGYNVRALDPVFRRYGVDAVFSAHDHHVERCLTGPAGFERKMDEKDVNNLNYFVVGNSGEGARKSGKDWHQWMDVLGNNLPPFYSRFFYNWAGTNHFSFLDVDIKKISENNWQATFQVIRDDGKVFDKFFITRNGLKN